LPLILTALAVVGCVGYWGCRKPAAPTPPAIPGLPTHAQPKLRTMKLWLGAEEIDAELALTPEQEQTGMMFRTNRLGEKEGMLFALPYTQRANFWMMNCPLTLSAAYISPDGVIQEIHVLEANNTNGVDAASANIRFVLEESEGWFERHHITTGTVVRAESGPLMNTVVPLQQGANR